MNGDDCTECEHPWVSHNISVGCLVGWTYEEGVAINQGCECVLANTETSDKEAR